MPRNLQTIHRNVVGIIEPLESRRHFSAVPTASVQDGILTIVGTANNDDIEVAYFPTSNTFALHLDGQSQSIPGTGVTGVVVHAGRGDDIVSLLGVGFLPDGTTPVTSIFLVPVTQPVNVPATIFGGHGDDILQGGNGDDVIHGNHGDDTISGSGGNNTLFGGAGDDTINYPYPLNTGADHVHGGPGDDTLYSTGQSTLRGGLGDDTLYQRGSTDHLRGGAGSNHLYADSTTILDLTALDTISPPQTFVINY